MTLVRTARLLPLVLGLVASACSPQPGQFDRIVLEQFARYPQMQAQDLYKLAFQAALGNEHLMVDTAMVRRYLLEELEGVEASSDEPLVEEINPEGTLVRVNLRPFKAAGLDPEALLLAMMRTAETVDPSEERLEVYLLSIRQLASEGRIPVDLRELLPYIEHQRMSGFPAVHHSSAYAETYVPAYRVTLRAFLPDIAKGQTASR